MGTPHSRTWGSEPLAELGTTLNRLLSSQEGQAGLATLSLPASANSWGRLCQGQPGGQELRSLGLCSLKSTLGRGRVVGLDENRQFVQH